MIRLSIILTIFILDSYNPQIVNSFSSERTKNTEFGLKPFEITIYSVDYSMAYTVQYVLTNKNFKIILRGELEGERDSILFRTALQANKTLKRLSHINIDNLHEYYSNPCIRDGSQIMIKLKKGFKNKTIHLSNYYQPDIGLAIELINSLTPKKYKIWYDKKTLLKEQENCK